MLTRTEYVEKKKKQLDEWNKEMAALEEKAHKSKEDVKEKYKAKLQLLRANQKKGIIQLESIKSATEESWEHLKAETENVWTALTDSVAQFRSHF